MAIEQFISEEDVLWQGITGRNYNLLCPSEKTAMFLRVAPMILGIYAEFGYKYDGLDDAKALLEYLET